MVSISKLPSILCRKIMEEVQEEVQEVEDE